jgi:hypothetical protein
MNYTQNLNYSGMTFNTNDEFYFDNERIIIIGFWKTISGDYLVDIKRPFPIINETISIDEMFSRYGNFLKTKINNTKISDIKKCCDNPLDL